MAEHMVTIKWSVGPPVLLCRKPLLKIGHPCSHPKWWQFWIPRYCAGHHLGWVREAYDTTGMCDTAKALIRSLPSYHEREAVDRRLHPHATPCSCTPPRPEAEP